MLWSSHSEGDHDEECREQCWRHFLLPPARKKSVRTVEPLFPPAWPQVALSSSITWLDGWMNEWMNRQKWPSSIFCSEFCLHMCLYYMLIAPLVYLKKLKRMSAVSYMDDTLDNQVLDQAGGKGNWSLFGAHVSRVLRAFMADVWGEALKPGTLDPIALGGLRQERDLPWTIPTFLWGFLHDWEATSPWLPWIQGKHNVAEKQGRCLVFLSIKFHPQVC